jgi:hypothetical protein
VYHARGDEEALIKLLRELAATTSADTHLHEMTVNDARSRAHEWLGSIYMKRGEYAEALKWWEAWKPWTFCGTCLESMERIRARGIATCCEKLSQMR